MGIVADTDIISTLSMLMTLLMLPLFVITVIQFLQSVSTYSTQQGLYYRKNVSIPIVMLSSIHTSP